MQLTGKFEGSFSITKVFVYETISKSVPVHRRACPTPSVARRSEGNKDAQRSNPVMDNRLVVSLNPISTLFLAAVSRGENCVKGHGESANGLSRLRDPQGFLPQHAHAGPRRMLTLGCAQQTPRERAPDFSLGKDSTLVVLFVEKFFRLQHRSSFSQAFAIQ
ncbi:hypothetical protein MGYG_04364 [Nannizzia gypsea CBS 118893]|uniref:Uncharacterized protein n=1 Tax=Arthroderma gypseum (strain ATCC MYA-4604 / CBS 118893) TaxID=535722 RepID=E4USK6_ARTGP|nr:hypothetical protein MGYG_04364 [Nannizzia gypsea CBS 118893]EFR01357.1 hypothetical protein MGYG_04364 [Nannizzia gypsea CBS 118893]